MIKLIIFSFHKRKSDVLYHKERIHLLKKYIYSD